jgi:arylsulfatase A-like enzyme
LAFELNICAEKWRASGCANPDRAAPTNVILISLDTLRADHVGCYGYSRPTTPVIDELAARGVVFERAIANSPWTLPSHASMLTGFRPRHHGVRSPEKALPEGFQTLATELLANGSQTMAIVNSFYLSHRFGLHRGFLQFKKFQTKSKGDRVRSGADQVDLAMKWITQNGEKPFFLFLHNYDVHSDYDPSPEFAEMFVRPYSGSANGTTHYLRKVRRGNANLDADGVQHVVDLYDAGIREIDHELGRLFEFLGNTGLLSRTLVIVTSDHGEEFLEHGGVLHGRTMYREVLEVPLIIAGPGVPEGRRVGQLVQLTDIFATVLELMGVEDAPSTDGTSLVAAWTKDSDTTSDRHAYAEADYKRKIGDDTLEMIRSERFKLIFERPTKAMWLYHLAVDPGEQVDVAAENNEVAEDFLDDLQRLFESGLSGVALPELTPAETEALRALGYVD